MYWTGLLSTLQKTKTRVANFVAATGGWKLQEIDLRWRQLKQLRKIEKIL